MERTLREALRHRRSYYALTDRSPVSDQEIENILREALEHTPSAFNSQSARLVLLAGGHHCRLWEIVRDALRPLTPPEAFERTEAKIAGSFASGYGTVLFYEDTTIIQSLQQRFPLYADRFPVWSEHTSAMHQLAVWTMLENAGFGASLQHYDPLIDAAVQAEWQLPSTWKLIAQMPFGLPSEEPGQKEYEPLAPRLRIFR